MKTTQLPSGPFSIATAQAHGISEKVLQRLARDGVLTRVHSGLYWLTAQMMAQEVMARHATIARAVAAELGGQYALAGETAAAGQGLWTPRRLPNGPGVIRLYSMDNRNATRARGLHISVSPIFPGDIVTSHGCAVTALHRTAIDLARGMAPRLAMIPLDHALRLGIPREQLLETALRMKQWRGTKLLGTLIPLASGKSESPLESASRAACLESGLPAPELQVALAGASGRPYRVDMLWPEFNLILEPDGITKYGATEAERRENFIREKEREDDLRAAGYFVLRVTWQTLPTVLDTLARRLTVRN